MNQTKVHVVEERTYEKKTLEGGTGYALTGILKSGKVISFTSHKSLAHLVKPAIEYSEADAVLLPLTVTDFQGRVSYRIAPDEE